MTLHALQRDSIPTLPSLKLQGDSPDSAPPGTLPRKSVKSQLSWLRYHTRQQVCTVLLL